MMRLFMEPHPENCTLLGNLSPPGLNETTRQYSKHNPVPIGASLERVHDQ